MRWRRSLSAAILLLSSAPIAVGDDLREMRPWMRYREHYGEVKVRCVDGWVRICEVATSGIWRLKAKLPLDAVDAASWDETTPVLVRVGDREVRTVFGEDTRLRLARSKVRLARRIPKTKLVIRWNRRGVLKVELRQRLGYLGKGELHPPLRNFSIDTDAEVSVGAHAASFDLPLRVKVRARPADDVLQPRLLHRRVSGLGVLQSR